MGLEWKVLMDKWLLNKFLSKEKIKGIVKEIEFIEK